MTRLRSSVCLAGVLALLVGALDAAGADAHRANSDPPRARVAIVTGADSHRADLDPPRAHAAIIGGAPAASSAFPWLAEVIDVRGHQVGQCTASVVAPRLVLTAAHCVESLRTGARYPASGFSVLTFDPTDTGGERQLSTVTGVIAYEGFRRDADVGDAALLALSAPVRAPAITLATGADAQQLQAGSTATIVGWGKTRFAQREPSESLHAAATVLQAGGWCVRAAPPFFVRGELCAIDAPSDATGGCNGDSGGPLLVSAPDGEPLQAGIAVHVYGRCSTRRPTVFTRVDAISSWLDSWIAAYAVPATPPAT